MTDAEYEFYSFWKEILEEEKQKGNTKRVKEIEDGECKALIEAIMAKPLEEIKELYNTREIEK